MLGCLGCQSLAIPEEAGIQPMEPAFLRAQDGATEAPSTGASSGGTPADMNMTAAAILIDQGDPEAAAIHLASYVAERPHHLTARVQLGELLFRTRQWEDARRHFEQFIEQGQTHGEAAGPHLLHCHARLAVIAAAREDNYEEQLHRGIGLYLLACKVEASGGSPELPPAETLFFRASEALQEARGEAPDEARPHFYLYQTWSRLGQRKAAARSLELCDDRAVGGMLTPKEQQELLIAVWKKQR